MRVIAFIAAFLFAASPALAQVVASVVPTTVITGAPIIDSIVIPWLLAFTTALIPVVIAWLSYVVNKKWHVQIDAGLRDGLQTSLINEAGVLIQRLGPAAASMTRLDVGNPTVAQAIQSVINRAPDAVARWPELKDGAAIAKMLEAKLGLLTGVTDANGAPVGAAKPSIPVTAPPGAGR